MHVLGNDKLLHRVEHDFALLKKLGNDAGDFSAIVEYTLSDDAHESNSPAAINKLNACFGHRRAKGAGGFRHKWGDLPFPEPQ